MLYAHVHIVQCLYTLRKITWRMWRQLINVRMHRHKQINPLVVHILFILSNILLTRRCFITTFKIFFPATFPAAPRKISVPGFTCVLHTGPEFWFYISPMWSLPGYGVAQGRFFLVIHICSWKTLITKKQFNVLNILSGILHFKGNKGIRAT
jgi:hypothetical protein